MSSLRERWSSNDDRARDMTDDAPEATPPQEMQPWLGWLWAAISLPLGVALLLHVAGVVTLETRAGPVLLGVVGVLCLVVGGYCAFLAIVNAARRGADADPAQLERIRRVSSAVGLVILVGLALTLTVVAYYAWLPEQRAAFSGGVTASVWELRFVWGFAALVFDLIAVAALWFWWKGRR
jgi:hypothetical protein